MRRLITEPPLLYRSSSSEAGLSRVSRRVIRGYFHGIGFPHRLLLCTYSIADSGGEW
jgi:hypothetical protein